MGNPYTSVSVSGYNANPPPDDGSAVEANRVKWATIKTKLDDTLKAALESVNTNVGAAFAKVVGGGGITSTGISYQVLGADQGKLVRASAGGITVTTPDATDVDDPFVFGIVNDGASDITVDGSGSQTIDGSANITLAPTDGVLMFTDGTNWFAIGRTRRTQVPPQGYLTLIATASDAINPVITSDQAAATAVYYRPTQAGNLVPISDGTNFTVKEFSQLTLTLVANHVANAIYDVFAFDDPSNPGTTVIGTGPAWTTATAGSGARGTGAGTSELALLKGLWVNNVAITARNSSTTYSVPLKCATYLGSISMDGTNGQVTCHVGYGQSRKWGVWNAYNRLPIRLRGGDATASWTPASTRASNGASANKVSVFQGLAQEPVKISFSQRGQATASTTGTPHEATIGIGVNVTNAFTGKLGDIFIQGTTGTAAVNRSDLVAMHELAPSIGINDIQALENLVQGANIVLYGTESFMELIASYRA